MKVKPIKITFMKAILIDVKNETVTEVDVRDNDTLKHWYELIGCELVETAMYINDSNDSIMVDEEALLSLTNESKFFSFIGGHQPFCGNGLIVGVDDEGESISPQVTVDDIRRKVNFFTYKQAQVMYTHKTH